MSRWRHMLAPGDMVRGPDGRVGMLMRVTLGYSRVGGTATVQYGARGPWSHVDVRELRLASPEELRAAGFGDGADLDWMAVA